MMMNCRRCSEPQHGVSESAVSVVCGHCSIILEYEAGARDGRADYYLHAALKADAAKKERRRRELADNDDGVIR